MTRASRTSSSSPSSATASGTISDNDSVICFNFRPDRAREITRAIVDPDFDGFKRDVLSDYLRLHARSMTHPCRT